MNRKQRTDWRFIPVVHWNAVSDFEAMQDAARVDLDASRRRVDRAYTACEREPTNPVLKLEYQERLCDLHDSLCIAEEWDVTL